MLKVGGFAFRVPVSSTLSCVLAVKISQLVLAVVSVPAAGPVKTRCWRPPAGPLWGPHRPHEARAVQAATTTAAALGRSMAEQKIAAAGVNWDSGRAGTGKQSQRTSPY